MSLRRSNEHEWRLWEGTCLPTPLGPPDPSGTPNTTGGAINNTMHYLVQIDSGLFVPLYNRAELVSPVSSLHHFGSAPF